MFDNVDEAFKDLDKNEYSHFANMFSAYREALMQQGFTRREALRLVEAYARLVYEFALEQAFGDGALDETPEDD